MPYSSTDAKMHSTGACHLTNGDTQEHTDCNHANIQSEPTSLMADREPGHAPSNFKLGNFAVDDPRRMKVVVIGAGFSGITAGIRFTQRVQNLDLTIYEANSGVGGTWLLNRYPGLACDIPSHCYQLTFEENLNWSSYYSGGPEIRAYLESIVDKYKLMRYIKLQHRLVHARYDAPTGKWHLRIRRPRTSQKDPVEFEEFEDTADVLFTALGGLSRWNWPDIEGLDAFEGRVVHSAMWDAGEDPNQGWEEGVKDWGDKKVGVIGVGSSAIQIVPALQPKVAHLTNYVRGKTWISSLFVAERMEKLAGGKPVANYQFTDADKEAFKDPDYYKKFRWELEAELNSAYGAILSGSDLQKGAQAAFRESMLQKLAKKPWIADHIIPDFAVACRRLTPGPGYLEALCEDNVDFVPTLIKRVTPTGIETVDGKHQEMDVIVCATGFDTSFKFEFPLIGRDGVDINEKYTPHPKTYLTVAVDGFPNWFQALGPNAGVGAGSLVIIIECQVDYAVQATLKLQRERLKSMEPKKEAVDDFDEYLEHYFPRTVFSEKCRSWYKMGKEEGRVVGLYPGSNLHAVRALAHPRWEDYKYEPLDDIKNRFYWLGDGQTIVQKVPNGDMASYLNEKIDYPPVPA